MLCALFAGAIALSIAVPASSGVDDGVELVGGTAVLLDIQSNAGVSGGGGNGGNAKSTSSDTTIFSPAAYADYKRFGGEPTVVVDKYPFQPGQFDCPATATNPCPPKDIAYDSAPQGFVFPHYSQFYKSDDLAATFRKPRHFPIHGGEFLSFGGGGDSHQVVGHRSHRVYYVDLPLDCVTMNVSEDLAETWATSDNLGCGLFAGLDDRQWVEEDESFGPNACPVGVSPTVRCGNVYVTYINFVDVFFPTLSLARSTRGAVPGTFVTDSTCNTVSQFDSALITSAPDNQPTACPDPRDPYLWVAGPPVADKLGIADDPATKANEARPPTDHVYIPFIRRISRPIGTGVFGIDAWLLYIAKSIDGGQEWTRHRVAVLAGTENPANIFPQLTIDRGGNLYYTWSETQGGIAESTIESPGKRPREREQTPQQGEQDVHYKFSTDGGVTWQPETPPVPEELIPDPTDVLPEDPPEGLPTEDGINLTKEANDTAVFPWMVAGDPGQVDVAYYKANTGVNSNIGFVDADGEECDPDDPEAVNCRANPSVWNVFFGQSQNALNLGPDFKSVQVSAQPNHIGQICTQGLACEGDRDLLDFIAFDVDSRGAAVIAYSDDNQRRATDTRDRVTRQLSGNSVFKNKTINLLGVWPIRNHTVYDRPHELAVPTQGTGSDVFDAASLPSPGCPEMDILSTSAERKDDKITITMLLGAAPTGARAIVCGREASLGGFWGAEFWAAADETETEPSVNLGPTNNFYIAYRDDTNGQRVEGGTMDNLNVAITSLEFNKRTEGTLSGDCLQPGPTPGTFVPTGVAPCTIAMTVSASSLGITPGNGLNNITGVTGYFFGADQRVPATRIMLGNSEQADATAPFHYLGSGTP